MKVYTHDDIVKLRIPTSKCLEWVKASFLSKPEADMPPKVLQHFPADIFFNTLPCVVPSISRFSVKVVSRHPGQDPALKSTILLMDYDSGDALACLDGTWITAMRTGAVAALAGQTFINDFPHAALAFVGLGAMARATFDCLLSCFNSVHDIWLLRYKDHAERFVERYEHHTNVRFHITDSREELVANTQALYSCVTVMNEQFLPPDAYPTGYTLIPVHMRGFQDCDVVFDKIFGDDRGYLEHFQHFKEFRYFGEFADVLMGVRPGRTASSERIISYNYGLALHDLWFASRIYDMLVA